MCEDLCVTCSMEEHERDIHQQFCTRAYKTSVLIMALKLGTKEDTHIICSKRQFVAARQLQTCRALSLYHTMIAIVNIAVKKGMMPVKRGTAQSMLVCFTFKVN